MMEAASKETRYAFFNVLDTFTGADGGIRFAILGNCIEQLDAQAHDDTLDAAAQANAQELVRVIHTMSRLIDATNGKQRNPSRSED